MSYPLSPMRIHWVNKVLHYTSYECSYHGSLFCPLYILYVLTWNEHLFLNLNLPTCLISSRVDVPFHLTSFTKCLAIVSSYTVLTSPFEELHVSIWNACMRPFEMSICVLNEPCPNLNHLLTCYTPYSSFCTCPRVLTCHVSSWLSSEYVSAHQDSLCHISS